MGESPEEVDTPEPSRSLVSLDAQCEKCPNKHAHNFIQLDPEKHPEAPHAQMVFMGSSPLTCMVVQIGHLYQILRCDFIECLNFKTRQAMFEYWMKDFKRQQEKQFNAAVLQARQEQRVMSGRRARKRNRARAKRGR